MLFTYNNKLYQVVHTHNLLQLKNQQLAYRCTISYHCLVASITFNQKTRWIYSTVSKLILLLSCQT